MKTNPLMDSEDQGEEQGHCYLGLASYALISAAYDCTGSAWVQAYFVPFGAYS